MINLTTGLPGHGKTLHTLWAVKKLAAESGRPVFYSGIDELALDWVEIDPEKWFDAPDGSIIVIDECQKIFRPRTMGKEVPEYVSRLETHRHRGIDIFLITQHPMLVDPSIRRLAENHQHVVRVFGMQASTIHKWMGVKDNCDKPSGKADSIKTKWFYPKEVFAYYKSAQLHTVKRKIPFRIWVLLSLPLFLGVAVWYMYGFFQKKSKPPIPPGAVLSAQQAPASAAGMSRASYQNAFEESKQFVYEATPRVIGLAYTSPKYDQITKATAAPVPVACVSSEDRCKCYTQQATRMDIPEKLCRELADTGFFQEFEPSPNKRSESQAVLNRPDGLPLSGARTTEAPVRSAAGPAATAATSAAPTRDPNTFGVVASRRDGVRVPTEN